VAVLMQGASLDDRAGERWRSDAAEPYRVFASVNWTVGIVTPKFQRKKMIYQLSAWNNVVRRRGFETGGSYRRIERSFLRKGLQLLVDNNTADKIRSVLEVDLHTYEQSHFQSARVWESAAGYSPTIGIMGAVLGLDVMQS